MPTLLRQPPAHNKKQSMKKIFSLMIAGAAMFSAGACCEIEDGTTDINSWPDPVKTYSPKTYTLSHPCMLHSADDITFTRDHIGQQPWADAYQKLVSNTGYCNSSYVASPVKYLARLDPTNWAAGSSRWELAGLQDIYEDGIQNNYTRFFRDAAAAYQLGLKYRLSDDPSAAATAQKIIEDWANFNEGILLGRGPRWKDDVIDSNEYLIMFQIHQIANAAELVRDYNGWGDTDSFKNVCSWLKTYFAPFCSRFIANNYTDHWWMNWDMASMTALLSIGILCDDQDIINEAILHFKQGEGPGCIMRKGIITMEADPSGTGEMLAQGNEAGRDQGHNTLCAVMLGTFCQMAYNIGEDLFSFEGGRAIAFAQYVAKYNKVLEGIDPTLGNLPQSSFKYTADTLPFVEYTYSGATMSAISPDGRGTVRPGWDIWVGYCRSHGIPATYLEEYAEDFRPDGGGGHYGGNSGGFDQLGFSTLMNYRDMPQGE